MVAVRAAGECSMMNEYGSDPQMAIWRAFMLAKVIVWFISAAVLVGLMVAAWSYRTVVGLIAFLLVVWSLWIGYASWQYQAGRMALRDAIPEG